MDHDTAEGGLQLNPTTHKIIPLHLQMGQLIAFDGDIEHSVPPVKRSYDRVTVVLFY